ncbi:MAG: tRNA 2-selenouridine(34) synthase MnmH [Burkholderiales bacterium]|nr:tRNA 2-selenouridine(34) synthase MnmH [Burkholderiales bacterium]
MKFPDTASVAQLDHFDEVIDVRSPAEYAEDHVPGARNHPVLDDAERAEIGTLYKRVSPFASKRRGAALVARNIARHLEEGFAAKERSWRPLVYCWRGGKRSEAMVHVLREVGWQAAQLQGGYKAYRREVVANLETLPATYRYIVLCGETGSAKSRLLQALAAAGAQTLDLEGLARHRGSVLGQLPGEPQPAQKMFETRLWNALRRLDDGRPVFVEAESKKIGQLQVPDGLIQRMRAAECVRVEAPAPERVRFLLAEYGHFLADPVALKTQLDCLAGLYGNDTVARWQALVDRAAWEELVGDLLANHYDPAYRRSTAKNFPRLAEARVLGVASLAPEAIGRAAAALIAETASETPALA